MSRLTCGIWINGDQFALRFDDLREYTAFRRAVDHGYSLPTMVTLFDGGQLWLRPSAIVAYTKPREAPRV